MEVKPRIVESAIFDALKKFGKLATNLLLTALLVDQVYKVLLVIL